MCHASFTKWFYLVISKIKIGRGGVLQLVPLKPMNLKWNLQGCFSIPVFTKQNQQKQKKQKNKKTEKTKKNKKNKKIFEKVRGHCCAMPVLPSDFALWSLKSRLGGGRGHAIGPTKTNEFEVKFARVLFHPSFYNTKSSFWSVVEF